MDIGHLLERRAILPKAGATSKRHVLTLIGETAARLYGLNAGEVVGALLTREERGSTGVGLGVAAPHARVKGLDRIHGVFARLETPVAFDAVDDQPVDLIFALFAPVEADSDHLRALARISRSLRRADLREQLRQARSPDAIHALLTQDEMTAAA